MLEEIIAIGKQARKDAGDADIKHLKKVIYTNRFFCFIGYALAWIVPNPISMFFLSTANMGRWIVAHHVLHKAYDNISSRYNSKVFAKGWRRYFQWLDWMHPSAWIYEHNILHHYYTNELLDPDQFLHHKERTVSIFLWKPLYYAKNTIKAEKEKKDYDARTGYAGYMRDVWLKCYIPHIFIYFILIPLIFLSINWVAALFVLINTLGAEILTNLHTFYIIGPGHIGKDLKIQTGHFKNHEDFLMHQLESTCNFNTGGFWRDYFHGYLNYQIEHHLFSDLTMLQYTMIQPVIKKICAQKGLPYIQESNYSRSKKLIEAFK